MFEVALIAMFGLGFGYMAVNDLKDDDEHGEDAPPMDDGGAIIPLDPEDPEDKDPEDKDPQDEDLPEGEPQDPGAPDPFPEGEDDDTETPPPVEPEPEPAEPEPEPEPFEPEPAEPAPTEPAEPEPEPTTPETPPPADPLLPVTPDPEAPTFRDGDLLTPSRDSLGNLVLGTGGTYGGTNGDDVFYGPPLRIETTMGTLTAPNGPASGVTVFMGAGTDIYVGNASDSTFVGMEGEDYIQTVGANTTLFGGAGNDMLLATSSGGTLIVGGTGDDLLELDRQGDATSGDTLRGGEGADSIYAAGSLSGDDLGGIEIHGGAGQDEIGLLIRAVDAPDADTPATGITIMDFDPAEDTLAVVLGTEAQLDYTGARIESHPAEGYSDLVLDYTDPATGQSWQGVIRLNGVTGLEIGDIRIAMEQASTTPDVWGQAS
ncbi:hypothetical protein [Pseudogemmobacter sonorensis]|uniref:hypothetical protein n=1 Tax=Pseudogemmobacter sonorensis TaxID=2989681 RepID=UPI0036886DB7